MHNLEQSITLVCDSYVRMLMGGTTLAFNSMVCMYVCVVLCICPLQVLEIVAEKADLFTPAKRLFTVDGRLVQSLEEIADKEEYVAVEGSKYVRTHTDHMYMQHADICP